MSSDSYTGLHGRSPYEGPYQAWRGKDEEHAAPEHWEDLNRGICPWCGRTVRWDEKRETWVLDPSLTVLVLTQDEFDKVLDRSGEADSDLAHVLEWQHSLNRPFDE